ncbi:MAG: OmpA family protein [Saprospiraceae bacterium]|nr:OmpA family protein [Saprospiraceae bacterium]
MRIHFTLVFLSLYVVLTGQEEMVVERCTALNRDIPINNIYVGGDNQKWVSNEEGLFVVHAADLSIPVDFKDGELSILQISDGNNDLRVDRAILEKELGGILSDGDEITAAFYNKEMDELWIGTRNNGLFLFWLDPKFKMVKRFNTRNTKMRSDHVNTIFVDKIGRHWIGTEDGVLVGKNLRWGLEEKYFRFQAITSNGREVWLLSEDLIWIVDESDNWNRLELPEQLTEGDIKDIAFDKDGRLWIASELLSMYEVASGAYKTFDGADYFTSSFVNCIAVDDEGAVWVGTEDKGLYLIEKASALTVTCLLDKPLSCEGKTDDAALAVHINGGQAPFSYTWDDGLEGANPTNLGSGTYIVTVTDSKGQSKVARGVVPNPRLTIAVEQIKHESPDGGSDAAASVSVEGGVPEYQYQWDNGERQATAERLSAGVHRITVTDDNNCSAVAEIEIVREIAELAVKLDAVKMVDCYGASSAEVEASVSGGEGPYDFAWSNAQLRGSIASSLKAGEYRVTVTDALGVKATAYVDIEQPEQLRVSVKDIVPTTGEESNGGASGAIRGGIGPYSLEWSNGSSGESVVGLAAGQHVLVVADANGCATSAEFQIPENILPLAVRINEQTSNICHGDEKATLEIIIEGGKKPFAFKWNDEHITGGHASGLAAGSYSLTVTDAAGNVGSASIRLPQPAELTADIRVDAPASVDNSDGKATVLADGGQGPYAYQWDNGEEGEKATGLAPGRHRATITDAVGCEATLEVEISENILALQASLEVTNPIKCAGDEDAAVQLTIEGGKEPFQIIWDGTSDSGQDRTGLSAGKYAVTVSDAVGTKEIASVSITQPRLLELSVRVESPASTGENDGQAMAQVKGGTGDYSYKWDTGEESSRAEQLGPGTHQVTVTDEAGCVATAELEIRENILALSASVDQTSEIRCNGESTASGKVQVDGGKGPYTFTWSDQDLQGADISTVKAGIYHVTVVDVTGTEASAEFRVTQPTMLEAEIVDSRPATDESTTDGKAKLSATGGTGQYIYGWDNGGTTLEVEDLAVGLHTVTVTDEAGCQTTLDFEIKKKILPALTAGRLRSGQVVKMEQLQFNADSASIEESSMPVLDELFTFLTDNPEIVVQVEGHTNGIPAHEFCDSLSTERARNVALYLTRKGVAGRRVYYKGYGKRKPLASNDTSDGRRRNQRVEIRILELRG